MLRVWGQRHYRTEWNALVPFLHELWLLRCIPRGPTIAHFLFAEFAAPRDSSWLRRRGAKVIGTFHASVRRQERVHGEYPLKNFDWISVVSRVQLPFFRERGFPDERLRVTHHGVDANYFRPANERRPGTPKKLRLLLVGSTERDHSFMADVCRNLPAREFELTLLTSKEGRAAYTGIDCVRIPGHLSDDGLLQAYQQADLLIMPLLDCTANNAILEAMACGTPVMTNRVGGIPEYVTDSCNIVMDGKEVNAWVARLNELREEPDSLEALRPFVREWAERFAWPVMAESFLDLYREAFSHG